MEIADQESDLYKELIRNCAFYLALYLRCGLMGTDKKMLSSYWMQVGQDGESQGSDS